MAVYGGALRLRDIKILLLIREGTGRGTGVSVSEVARESGTPLESVRRQLKQMTKSGLLRTAPDPEDGRVIRHFATQAMADQWPLDALITRLSRVLGPRPDAAVAGPPFALLLALIDLFINGYMGSIRIRGARMALLVYRATQKGTGVAISDLARVNAAPLETVRRVLAQHVDMGHIRFVEDPEDDRKTLVVTADMTFERQRIAEMDKKLEAIEATWRQPSGIGPARE